jgi:nucleobase:cation symporter-1, NCS1 family
MAVIFARYGVEHWLGSAAVLGHRFKDIWLFLYITSSFGWIAYASFLFGESAIKFVKVFNGPAIFTQEIPGAVVFAIIATLVGTCVAYLGPTTLKYFTRTTAVFLLIVLGFFIWMVFAKFGMSSIFNAQPARPFEDLALSRASAIEYNVGLGFSWAFWYGQWTRLAKTESAAFHGCLWGWGILAATAGIFSAFVALMLGVFDPSEWIFTLGGGLAALGLVLFAVANVSSVTTLVYPMAISLRSRFPNLGWIYAIIICSLPAILLENPMIFESYGVYLAYIALLTGTYGGIMMADYYFVSRKRFIWHMRDLYLYGPESRYWYWGGFNPAAVIATLAAAGFYLWTLDPLNWESPNGLFRYITAGVPSFIVAFIVYSVIMRLWVLPTMKTNPSEESVEWKSGEGSKI